MTFLYDPSIISYLEKVLDKKAQAASVPSSQEISNTIKYLFDDLKLNLLSGDALKGESGKISAGQIFYKDIVSLDAFLQYLEKNVIKIGPSRLVINSEDREEEDVYKMMGSDALRGKYLKYKEKFLVYVPGVKQYLSNLSQAIQDPVVKRQLSELLSQASSQLNINLSSGQVPGVSQSGGGAGAASSQQGASAAPGAAGAQVPGQSGTMGASQGPAFGNQQGQQQKTLITSVMDSMPFKTTEYLNVDDCLEFADTLKLVASRDPNVKKDLIKYFAQVEQVSNNMRQSVAAWKSRTQNTSQIDYNLSGKLPTLAEIVSPLVASKMPNASTPNFKAALKDSLGLLKDIVNYTVNLLNLMKRSSGFQNFTTTIDNNMETGRKYFNDIQAQISRV